MPFTAEQFFTVFETFNRAIWPAQIVGYVLALASLLAIGVRTNRAGRINSAILSLFWLFTGLIYHLIFFSQINKAALAFGMLFLIEGILIAILGLIKNHLQLSLSTSWRDWLGYLFILYSAITYPLLGSYFGHSYPRVPTFPLTPCPLVIFTFGILLLSKRPVKWYLWLIPFLWSTVGTFAAVKLGVYQDYGLFLTGLLGTIALMTAKTGGSISK